MGEEKFDEFVEGDAMAKEAEEMFGNEGKPVHYLSLSTRFGGVNVPRVHADRHRVIPFKEVHRHLQPQLFQQVHEELYESSTHYSSLWVE
jgi:hypothetical protein